MRNPLKLALCLVLAVAIGTPIMSLPSGSALAKAADPVATNYKTIRTALKKELRELNAQLQSKPVKAKIKLLEARVDEARKIELSYRAAVDAGKSESELLKLAMDWGDCFQPIYDLQSTISADLGLAESEIDKKLEAIQAVPRLYAKDRKEIEGMIAPYQELSALNNRAVSYINPIMQILLESASMQGKTDAELEAFFAGELVRVLNARKVARK